MTSKSATRFHILFVRLVFASASFVCCFAFTHRTACQAQTEKQYERARHRMVELYVEQAGVKDSRVLQSMRDTKRHEFMPRKVRPQAYLDAGVPIGEQQTISSPFIVAYMTESLDPKPTDKVLEIGTGSGYQAAILSPLVKEVYSIEIVEPLGKTAAETLERLDYKNVFTMIGDGFKGWPEHAPFDKIIVTCSPEKVPQPLIDQLAEGGLMVVPVGERHQQTLYLLRKEDGKLVEQSLRPTLFVPMTGAAEQNREVKPDPANPTIINGDFEMAADENGFVKGWYYQRQMELVKDAGAPGGEHFVTFNNNEPGHASHLMQAFAIDGEVIKELTLTASVKTENVIKGPDRSDLPLVVVTFYDDERRDVGSAFIGPFRGSRAWQHFNHDIKVPKSANEAIVRIGLFGATGSASFDQIGIDVKSRR
jgi:protein-L-isoaspartate(D-aspartate) O-methyltransferase